MTRRTIFICTTIALLGCTPFAGFDPKDSEPKGPEPKAQPPEMGLPDVRVDLEDAEQDLPPSSDIEPEDDLSPSTKPNVNIASNESGQPTLSWDKEEMAATTEVCVEEVCIQVEGNSWTNENATWPHITPDSDLRVEPHDDGVLLHASPTFEEQAQTYTVVHKDAEGKILSASEPKSFARQVARWEYQWQRSDSETLGDVWRNLGLKTQWGLRLLDQGIPKDGTSRWYRIAYRPQGAETDYAFTTALEGRTALTRQVGAGTGYQCAFLTSGDIKCWGDASTGRLGLGDVDSLNIASRLTLTSPATYLAVGSNHSCALLDDGSLHCWGSNTGGQIGPNFAGAFSKIPIAVATPETADLLAAGEQQTCARLASGNITCWGKGTNGALGDGTTTDRNTPDLGWSPPASVEAIALGTDFGCILAGSQVHCWGSNTASQLGFVGAPTSTSTLVQGLSQVTSIDVGSSHACAISNQGLHCWGWNQYGQLGHNDAALSLPATSQTVSLPSPPLQVATGRAHTCALSQDGEVRCWGYNEQGQLGLGDTTRRLAPSTSVQLPGPATAIVAGTDHTCANVGVDVYCWGKNVLIPATSNTPASMGYIGDEPGEMPLKFEL